MLPNINFFNSSNSLIRIDPNFGITKDNKDNKDEY
jgi:hypothetical protein